MDEESESMSAHITAETHYSETKRNGPTDLDAKVNAAT
jgi:hypothetical protein